MRRFIRRLRRGEKGFTLIELLIVIAILGILAAVVIPNAAGFMATGRINGANTEVANVKTAAVGYMAEEGHWPLADAGITQGTTGGVLAPYLTGTLKATYVFDQTAGNEGLIATATTDADGWGTDIHWEPSGTQAQQWVRGAPPPP